MGNLNELNDILFEQLNILRNTGKSEEEREKTFAENKAIVDTAECILKNARLQLDVLPVEQNGNTAKYQFQMEASGNEKEHYSFLNHTYCK